MLQFFAQRVDKVFAFVSDLTAFFLVPIASTRQLQGVIKDVWDCRSIPRSAIAPRLGLLRQRSNLGFGNLPDRKD